MNPPIFTLSRTAEDSQEFVEEVLKIIMAMGDMEIKKAELASYQLKDFVKAWCMMWQDRRVLGGGLIT